MMLEARAIGLPGRLAEMSLDVPAGELVCLVGPNGSGKTSLLHTVAGIGEARGAVRIDGVDPRSLGPDARRRLLSYLPASRDVRWPVSASDLVALGLPGRGGRDAIAALLEELGLSDFAGRRVDRMSTGERSRVLIARALAAEPKLLLLDEPVANLDPLWQLRLMERLRGRTALVAMHDLDLAARYADRMLVLDRGRVVADGSPADILGSETIPAVFGIERAEERWRPVPGHSSP